jgi:hypothetical protein
MILDNKRRMISIDGRLPTVSGTRDPFRVRSELEGLLEGRPGRRGRALRERLSAKVDKVHRQRRRGRLGPDRRPSQDDAKEHTGAGPP